MEITNEGINTDVGSKLHLGSLSWAEQRISGLDTINNPYSTEKTSAFVKTDPLKNHRTVKIITDECSVLKTIPIDETAHPPELVAKPQFRTDLTLTRPAKLVGPDGINAVYAITAADPKSYKVYNIDLSNKDFHNEPPYLQLFCDDICFGSPDKPVEIIEPVVCTAYIYDKNALKSEAWNFWTPSFSNFFSGESQQESAFELRGISEDACLVILFARIFMSDGGAACDKYYSKPTSANLQKARTQVSASYPKNKGIYTNFGFTLMKISDLTQEDSQDPICFPPLMPLDKALNIDAINTALEKLRLKKPVNTLPLVVKMMARVANYEFEDEIESGITYSTLPFELNPILKVYHTLQLRLLNAKFDLPSKIKFAQNIVCDISLVDDKGNKLNAFKTRWDQTSNDLVDTYRSTMRQHDRSPTYTETVTVELPYPLPKRLMLQFLFSHIPEKEKDQFASFGRAALDLLTPDGVCIINDSTISMGINYDDKFDAATNALPGNQFNISTHFHSTLSSPIKSLSNLLSGTNPLINVSELDDQIVYNYLYQILDGLIESLEQDSTKAVLNMIECGRLGKTDDFLNFIFSYVSYFAFREGTKFSTQAHVHILNGWAQYMNNQAAELKAKRLDVSVSHFLFSLCLKSIVATGDKDFLDPLNKFMTAFTKSVRELTHLGLMQTKRIAAALAFFTSTLSDLGFYKEASLILCKFALSDTSRSTESHEITIVYLEAALHPRLFHALVVSDDVFISKLSDCVSQTIAQPNSQVLQGVYRIIGRLLTFTVPEDQPEIASRLLPILQRFHDKMTISAEQAMPFAIFAFICRFSRRDDFAKFLDQLGPKKKDFFNLLHFFLVKSKFTEDEKVSGIDSAAALNSLESRFSVSNRPPTPVNLSPPSFGAGGSISKGTGRRNFASMRGSNTFAATLSTEKEPVGISRQTASDLQLGILHIGHLLLEVGDAYPRTVILLIYRLISMNLSMDAFKPLIDLFSEILEKHTTDVFECPEPPIALVFQKLLSMGVTESEFVAEKMADIFVMLFTSERKSYASNNRGLAAVTRAVSLISDRATQSSSTFKALKARSDSEPCIKEVVDMLQKLSILINEMEEIDPTHYKSLRANPPIVLEASTPTTNIERYGDDLYERALILQRSPDALVETLSLLAAYHKKNQLLSEALMTYLYQIGVVTEYLTLCGRMIRIYDMEHPALAFAPLCPALSDACCPDHILVDLPDIPAFCDSAPFSEAGIFAILQDVMRFAKQSRLFELANEILRLAYPLLEGHGMYQQLATMYQQSKMSYQVIMSMSGDIDRMFGRYYRVAFYGHILEREDGKVYIYRETKLANLFEVSVRIEKTYQNLYGNDKIIIIKESGKVDPLLLERDKGYIQITSVQPYFDKAESNKRITVFERGNRLERFQFETPFVKGSKKLQGNVDTQWLRKSILKVKHQVPSLTKRMEVDGFTYIEYEPIRVASRQIKERLVLYRKAMAEKSIQNILPLLHGSLLVQVNEGPTKMAEVFLSGPRTKYTEKMRAYFREFIVLNEEGLKLNSDLMNDPTQMALHMELENGLTKLKETLQPYLK